MEDSKRAQAADALYGVYQNRTPIDPLSSTYPEATIEDAYVIQKRVIDRMIAGGRTIKGYKVGLTSLAMQKQLGVDQPDFGHILDNFFFLEHMPVPADTYIQPKVEPEIAFVLKKPLKGPGVTVADAISAVDYVLPALEIIDSRIRDWKIGIVDTVADNASSGGLILGSHPTRIDAVDLRLAGCTLVHNGTVVATGAGGAILGSPINSLVWMANMLGSLGVTFEPGHVVLPGSVTAAYPVAPGDVYFANFGPLGGVTAVFGN